MKTEKLQSKIFRALFVVATVYFWISVSHSLYAQVGTANKEKMERLAKWEGKWKGEGWSVDETRQRTVFTVEENIQWKLGGYAILAEGIGTNKSDGEVGFQSMGMIYYNNEKDTYEMKSILADGGVSLSKAGFNDKDQFVWSFDLPGGAKIEYTTTLTDTTWNEKGAYILPSGQVYPILEMNLTKVQ